MGISQDIKNIRIAVRDHLEKSRDCTLESMMWMQSPDEITAARKQMNVRAAAGRLFEDIFRSLPDSFDFFLFEPQPRTREERLPLRAEFNDYARGGFMRFVFNHEASRQNLLEMGLMPQDLDDYLERRKLPQIASHTASHEPEHHMIYDLSIDHLVDLSLGGTNGFDNLCIMPLYLNTMKSDFVKVQTAAGLEQVVSFRPRPDKEGNRTYVPVIPYGFRGSSHQRDRLIERREVLLETTTRTRAETFRKPLAGLA